jgi:hypothetical protein
VRAAEHRALDRVVGERQFGARPAVASAIGVHREPVVAERHAGDDAGIAAGCVVAYKARSDVSAIELNAHVLHWHIAWHVNAYKGVATADGVWPSREHLNIKVKRWHVRRGVRGRERCGGEYQPQ